MAKPIKETPVLTGEDARRFIEQTNNVVKVSPELKARMQANYERMSAIAK